MKPSLFNTEMVKAIMRGDKTVTRRVVKPQPEENVLRYCEDRDVERFLSTERQRLKPPYQPGDILYVREAFWKDNEDRYYYKADSDLVFFENDVGFGFGWYQPKWHPSIHMPKEAARIFLRVTDVRVERLREMRIEDAQAEGVVDGIPCDCNSGIFCSRCCNTGWIKSPLSGFSALWDNCIKPSDISAYGWDANPWVWVIAFEQISKEEAMNDA